MNRNKPLTEMKAPEGKVEQEEEEEIADEPSEVVVALIGNTSWEVGIALLDLGRPVLSLYQLQDDRIFSSTSKLLDSLDIINILVPNSHVQKSRLINMLKQKYLNSVDEKHKAYSTLRSAHNQMEGLLEKHTTQTLFNSEEALPRKQFKPSLVEIIPISRKLFNENNGMERVLHLQANLSTLSTKDLGPFYLARAAASALLDHLSKNQGVLFVENSLLIKLEGLKKRINMNGVTIRDLELFRNLMTKKRKGSLADILDFTCTPMGGRLLRKEILGPTNCPVLIKRRQNAVQFLYLGRQQNIRILLDEILMSLHDMDALATFYSVRPRQYSPDLIQREVDNAIRIREVLLSLPKLINPLKSLINTSQEPDQIKKIQDNHGQSIFESTLSAISTSLNFFTSVVNDIDKTINVNTEFRRQSCRDQRQEALFAIKKNQDGHLDIARTTYSHTLMEMRHLIQRYSNLYPKLSIQLNWTKKRGYHVKFREIKTRNMKRNKGTSTSSRSSHKKQRHTLETASQLSAKTSNLRSECGESVHAVNVVTNGIIPDIFIQQVKQRSMITCTTEELLSLCQREEQTAKIILERTITVLGGIRSTIKTMLPHFFLVTEKIAEIDMLLCICAYMEENTDHAFPDFREDGSLLLQNAWHPMMQTYIQAECNMSSATRNSIDMSVNRAKLSLINGPNGSGKSTLIKMVAVICVMAHMGFPVPAQVAKVPYLSNILTRIGTEDNLEGNSSTFSVEMQNLAHILETLKKSSEYKTSNVSDTTSTTSLVLIDELGRGTSISDGTALAWAVCESLLEYNALSMFVTHFSILGHISSQLPNKVKSLHFESVKDPNNNSAAARLRTHFLTEGLTNLTEEENGAYGIRIAQLVGMDEPVIKKAYEIREKMIMEYSKKFELSKSKSLVNNSEEKPGAQGSFNCSSLKSVLLELKADIKSYTLKQQRELLQIIQQNTTVIHE